MARHFDDWLTAFVDYAKFGEAPRRMYFWSGVSALAGALRRKVWIDQIYFRWYPNFYICLVAPPGIVSKSTTAGIGMNLLRQVPDIRFGPDVVTWQALVKTFADSAENFEYLGYQHVMSPITLESSEFGNLLNPQDKEMVDLLVSLWDGKQGGFEKKTKGSGNDIIENPWINLIACTTPSWIAGNFPEYMIGGGFTSRCVFVYADQKSKYVAYPSLDVPTDLAETQRKLVEDLTHISKNLTGEYKLSADAIEWGKLWYEDHYTKLHEHLDDERFGGYIARKQTHIHKLAMVLAASASDRMVITAENLALADAMVTDLEPDMVHVFSKIGKGETSLHTDRFIWYVRKRGRCLFMEAYQHIHSYFPQFREFEDMLTGCQKAGLIKMETDKSGKIWVEAINLEPSDAEIEQAKALRA
jgi:Protein of unknown function (DUF3987)